MQNDEPNGPMSDAKGADVLPMSAARARSEGWRELPELDSEHPNDIMRMPGVSDAKVIIIEADSSLVVAGGLEDDWVAPRWP